VSGGVNQNVSQFFRIFVNILSHSPNLQEHHVFSRVRLRNKPDIAEKLHFIIVLLQGWMGLWIFTINHREDMMF